MTTWLQAPWQGMGDWDGPKVVSERREHGRGGSFNHEQEGSPGADYSFQQGLGGSQLWGQCCVGLLGTRPAHRDFHPGGISTEWVQNPDSKVAEGLIVGEEEG